ncbi:hypothetical protein [Novosphingobium sp. AP12]|uniref:hypothetical protein n=1 Tax=Novosphingobium sp. AP12 TaxID=1144305 RepID=UPI0002721A2A|nr:hypothetical protein [Novosphingobium sp. AP12]EJL23688.1 hypothetical protein PMI02_04031 [Novosphingobium sp. AP12]
MAYEDQLATLLERNAALFAGMEPIQNGVEYRRDTPEAGADLPIDARFNSIDPLTGLRRRYRRIDAAPGFVDEGPFVEPGDVGLIGYPTDSSQLPVSDPQAEALVGRQELADPSGSQKVGFSLLAGVPVATDLENLLKEKVTARKLGIVPSEVDQTDKIRARFASVGMGVIDFRDAGPIVVSDEIRITTPLHLIGPGGYFENYGAIPRGAYWKLKDDASLPVGKALMRILYQGAQRDSRLAARVSGFAFFGNKGNLDSHADGLVLHGARYAQADDCIFLQHAGAGFRTQTGGAQGATQSNTRLRQLVSLYNRGNGYILACPDTAAFGLIAGANTASGFNISAVTELLGALAWNNGVDGIYIEGDWMRVQASAYDNNRCGIYVNGARIGVNLDGSKVLRNGLDLLAVGYATDLRSGVFFAGAAQGCSARGLLTGNNTDGADAGRSPQTYGLIVGLEGVEAQVDYDTPTSARDGVIRYIRVTSEGSGYTFANVAITGAASGSGATAAATVVDGKVVGITITNGGSGYAGRPASPGFPELPGAPIVVTITGDGTGAAAVASHGGNVFGPVKDYSVRSGERVSKLLIGDGTPVKKIYSVTVNQALPTLAAGATDSWNYASSALGIAAGDTDFVPSVHVAGMPGGVQITVSLTAANTLTITRTNHSAASVASGTFAMRVMVARFAS